MILDNLNEIYQEVLEELSYRVGIVNLRNKNHVDILSEILDTTELAQYKSDILSELYKNVITELEFKDKAAFADYKSQHKMRPDTIVTIGDKETTVGAASDTSTAKQNKQKKDSKKSEKQPSKNDNLKKFSKPMVADRTNRLAKLAEKVKNSDKDTQKRAAILIKNWNKFMNATTEKEKVEAMREMAEYNLIQGHAGGKKVYVSNSLPVDEKYLTGDSGDEITKDMNRVMKENDIYIPMRGSTLDRQKADLSGKHNEAGVVAELDASNENIKNRDEVAKKYSEVGGDVKKSDEDNKKAANAVKESILQNFPNSKIIKATQVGGIGSTALNKLGIDPKTDPTDIIVEIQTESGETVFVKYSLKVYDDPRNITMKNSGVNNAGEVYLGGDAGNKIDTFKRELDKKYSWTNEMSSAEQNKNKTAYRQEYLKKYAEELEKISKTPEGQSQLLKMWQSVHGCGKGVSTLITNKRTGESVVHSPEYYCNPKQPFKIEYDGVKIVVNMSGKDDSTYLQLDLKTEKNNSKKLLFRHRIK